MACTAVQGPHPHLRETVPHFLPTPKMWCRGPPCAVAPKLSPAESKCTLKSFRCALLCGADIRLDQNPICRVRAAAAAALSRLRWSTSGLLVYALYLPMVLVLGARTLIHLIRFGPGHLIHLIACPAGWAAKSESRNSRNSLSGKPPWKTIRRPQKNTFVLSPKRSSVPNGL